MFNYNAEIETLLENIGVPVAFMFYEGNADTYITYMQAYKEGAIAGDDKVLGCIEYYDFDVYSKGNYLDLVTTLIETLTAAGWTYSPSRDSPDQYERDTKFFHKTICLCKESEVEENG